jgi:hypothetical protein
VNSLGDELDSSPQKKIFLFVPVCSRISRIPDCESPNACLSSTTVFNYIFSISVVSFLSLSNLEYLTLGLTKFDDIKG